MPSLPSVVVVASREDALQLLARDGARARIVAGATDLIIELERKVRSGISILIDITRVPGLSELTVSSDDWVHIGPIVTHNQVCASPLMQARALPLAQACWEVGAPQIRNRATVAGNLITASPANDTITPLMALGAVVTLASAERGERRVNLAAFYTGVRKTIMAPDEMLVDIAFPAMKPSERGIFIKLGLRRAQAISIANVAVIADVTHGHDDLQPRVTRARITMGSVAPTIVHASAAEASLEGRELTDEVIDNAAALAQAAVRPISDIRAPADYRLAMVGTLVRRAIEAIRSGDTRAGLPNDPILLSATGAVPYLPHARVDDAGITLTVNGRAVSVNPATNKTLMRVLREDAELTGTKEGCAEGECGACTVLLNGAAVMSCLVPAQSAVGMEVTTVEGLTANAPHARLQHAFVTEAAVQCGYCTPGLLMSGAALLNERTSIDRTHVEQALAGNLCRCTGYFKVVEAFATATRAQTTTVPGGAA